MTEVMPTNNFSGRPILTQEDRARLEHMATLVYEWSRWMEVLIASIQKPRGGVADDSPFALAKITDVNIIGGLPVYSAESIAGPGLTVTNATPYNRYHDPAPIVQMEVDDLCILFHDPVEDEVRLVQFKETPDFAACAPGFAGGGVAQASFSGGSIAQQQSNLSHGEFTDWLATRS